MSQLFKNNAKSRLASAITSTSTSFTVITGEGNSLFPTLPLGDDHMLVTLENAVGDKEIVKIIERAGDTFTIGEFSSGTPSVSLLGRAQEGTTALNFDVQDLVELRLTAGFIDALKEGSIVFVIDGGGSAIGTGIKGWIEAPFNGTIKSARLFADEVTGTISVRIYKSTYANYPFTAGVDDAELISSGLSISSGYKAQFTNLSTWVQRNFSKGDIFIFDVQSCTGFTKCTISLTVDRF